MSAVRRGCLVPATDGRAVLSARGAHVDAAAVTVDDAARAYVAARLANEQADGANMLVTVGEVDRCWFELCKACGVVPAVESGAE